MYRKKSRENGTAIRFGIRMQMTVGLVAVFLISGIFLYWISDRQLQNSREDQIIRELQTIRENTEIYVRQLLILNDANNDEESFDNLAETIVQEMYGSSGRYELAAYSKDGELLAYNYRKNHSDDQEGGAAELKEAVDGNTAFTLVYSEEGALEVWFAMPVIVADKNVGIIRYCMDYTELWQQGEQMKGIIIRAAAAVFAAAFVLIFLLLNRIIKPVQRLTKVSRQMSLDLEQDEVNTELLAGLVSSARRDEMGELSRHYSAMLGKVGQYIQKMQDDRDQILKLLNSRQEFYNNVTHELKTPLTTIQGYAQLIEADQGSDEELVEKGVEHILHESTRLHRMVIQLLEMADRAEREEKTQVDMGNLIRSVSEAMEIKANRYGAYIRLKLEQDLYVWGQEERLRQVFINLIDNAVKYGEEGTEIRISGGHRKGRMLFSVSNKGKPMSQEELKHIFEPFYRADKEFSREQGSAGLGLSICQKIIREHKGAIWAENRPGERIGFFLLFPELEGQNPGKETYEGQNL
ncbi:MAG: GHKL domain-containing protein [Lachnospiraceae bacterium]|nr:GHKL domain-containing protein [Lachnospiraceae bacterium]MCI9383272.1 GHKL domain-containing protein [Lachnospiraceae bacterium]MCI9624391.1 GHKL domain-containing protein [Lachnospiraceae bacterium]